MTKYTKKQTSQESNPGIRLRKFMVHLNGVIIG